MEQSITLPEGWTAPKFQLGQTVYIEGTDNQAFTVMGLLFTTRGKYEDPYWLYQMTDRPKDSILHVFHTYHGTNIDEAEISAEPWPIEDEVCAGVQYPCGKPAAYWITTWTGDDYETRNSVSLAYCPACYAEMERIDREAREDKTRVAV